MDHRGRKNYGKRYTDFDIQLCQRIVSMYKSGLPTTQIFKQLTQENCNVTYSGVARILRNENVELHTKNVSAKQTSYNEIRICKHCNDSFKISNPAQIYCVICCPTRKAYQRLKLYQLSQSDFDKMIAEQRNLCKLCAEQLIDGGATNLNIDHCHSSGKVRGILCHRCNMIVGFLDKGSWIDQLHKIETYVRGYVK